jgi:hypothetical protein
MRRALATLAMFVALSTPALSQTPLHQEILGFKLGQPAPELTDVRDLPDVLGEDITRDMTGFMMVEQPNPRYQIALKDNRRLTLWFDASKKERPIYWIELVQSYDPPLDAHDRIEQDLGGPPDFRISGPTGAPLGLLFIRIDPTLPPERSAAIKQHINDVIARRPKEQGSQEDPFIEPGGTLQSWLEILGDNFRGKLVSTYIMSLRINDTITVLIDTAAAHRAQSETAQ